MATLDQAALNPQPLPPHERVAGPHPDPWAAFGGGHPDPWRTVAATMISAIALREAAHLVEGGGLMVRIAQQMIDDCGSIGPRRPKIPPGPFPPEPEPDPRWRAALAQEVIAQAMTLPNVAQQSAAFGEAARLLTR